MQRYKLNTFLITYYIFSFSRLLHFSHAQDSVFQMFKHYSHQKPYANCNKGSNGFLAYFEQNEYICTEIESKISYV